MVMMLLSIEKTGERRVHLEHLTTHFYSGLNTDSITLMMFVFFRFRYFVAIDR